MCMLIIIDTFIDVIIELTQVLSRDFISWSIGPISPKLPKPQPDKPGPPLKINKTYIQYVQTK